LPKERVIGIEENTKLLNLNFAAIVHIFLAVLRIRIRAPELFGAFSTPGIQDPGWKKSGSGSGIQDENDHISESLETIFCVKNT
jgi:hypothetical protein